MKLNKYRTWILAVGCLICLAVAIYYTVPRIQVWSYLRAAKQSLQQGNNLLAYRWYEKAYSKKPEDPFILRQLIYTASQHSGLDERIWWSRLMDLAPEKIDYALDFAAWALEKKQAEAAVKVLNRFSDHSQVPDDYLCLLAQLHIQQQQYAEAEKYTRLYLDHNPEDESMQLLLLKVLLKRRESGRGNEVQAITGKLYQHENTRLVATRALIHSAAEYGELSSAYLLSQEVLSDRNRNTDDLIRHLQLSLKLDEPKVEQALEFLTPVIHEDRQLLGRIAALLIKSDKSDVGLKWLGQQDVSLKPDLYYRIAEVNLRMALGQYQKVETLLNNQEWGKNEVYRISLLARCLKQEERLLESTIQWNDALALARQHHGLQLVLLGAVSVWEDWNVEREQLLWEILNQGIYVDIAYAQLKNVYRERSDLNGLLKLTAQMRKLKPGEMNYEYDYIFLSLLAERDLDLAGQLASQVYRQNPEQVVPVLLYSFSLYRKGKSADAVQTMKKIEAMAELVPEVAYYMAVFLKSTGAQKQAEHYVKKATGARLMAQEVELWRSS